MRTLLAAVCLVVIPLPAMAEPLSSADREALLENLEKIRNTVTERVDARYRLAIAAYRAAMLDEQQALAFYLKCTEKVNFTDLGKRPSDFRDWKKRADERMGEASMRRALMHQLRWLVLTLRASSENADSDQLSREGMDAIEDLFHDQVTLATQRQLIGQSVLSSVFAKAYDIEGVKSEKWPTAPLDFAKFFEGIVFPKYRNSGDIKNLRSAWIRRIQMEREMGERPPTTKAKGNGRDANTPPDPTPDQERFQTDILPDLQWQMEIDLFQCGDQQAAAPRMLAHLEKHLTHPKARDWSDQLRNLLRTGTISGPQSGEQPPAPPAP
ncbi:MAG: hypothetical protein K9N23_13855 [Akkermansiaceae bacterium]|nr:hypothetical protein [Akkermansiaceae bacterium]